MTVNYDCIFWVNQRKLIWPIPDRQGPACIRGFTIIMLSFYSNRDQLV